jgi:hypothetical protein
MTYTLYAEYNSGERRLIVDGIPSKDVGLNYVRDLETEEQWPEGCDAVLENVATGDVFLLGIRNQWRLMVVLPRVVPNPPASSHADFRYGRHDLQVIAQIQVNDRLALRRAAFLQAAREGMTTVEYRKERGGRGSRHAMTCDVELLLFAGVLDFACGYKLGEVTTTEYEG